MENYIKDTDKCVRQENCVLSAPEPQSDYERYCQQQADAFFDEIGDDRCFGDMAEGQFVRGH